MASAYAPNIKKFGTLGFRLIELKTFPDELLGVDKLEAIR